MAVPRWTIVIPYHNEEAWLPATLDSLSNQTLRPFRVVLIDNASTDEGPALAAEWARAQSGINVTLLAETRPGTVSAREAATLHIDTEFVAFADADTLYPPHYLEEADRLFQAHRPDVIGLVAHNSDRLVPRPLTRFRHLLYHRLISRLLTYQVHNGAYAQMFRSSAYVASGGYSTTLWSCILDDHELANRIWKIGRIVMPDTLWVVTSARRADRTAVQWTLFERILYHATLPSQKDWFFYRFLKPRFIARGQKDTVLRQQSWATPRPDCP
jgi:glycosyltransferase involved in cell wall biosynthesis